MKDTLLYLMKLCGQLMSYDEEDNIRIQSKPLWRAKYRVWLWLYAIYNKVI